MCSSWSNFNYLFCIYIGHGSEYLGSPPNSNFCQATPPRRSSHLPCTYDDSCMKGNNRQQAPSNFRSPYINSVSPNAQATWNANNSRPSCAVAGELLQSASSNTHQQQNEQTPPMLVAKQQQPSKLPLEKLQMLAADIPQNNDMQSSPSPGSNCDNRPMCRQSLTPSGYGGSSQRPGFSGNVLERPASVQPSMMISSAYVAPPESLTPHSYTTSIAQDMYSRNTNYQYHHPGRYDRHKFTHEMGRGAQRGWAPGEHQALVSSGHIPPNYGHPMKDYGRTINGEFRAFAAPHPNSRSRVNDDARLNPAQVHVLRTGAPGSFGRDNNWSNPLVFTGQQSLSREADRLTQNAAYAANFASLPPGIQANKTKYAAGYQYQDQQCTSYQGHHNQNKFYTHNKYSYR